MALYPDTSCFYRAEVVAAPSDLHPSGRVSGLSCTTAGELIATAEWRFPQMRIYV